MRTEKRKNLKKSMLRNAITTTQNFKEGFQWLHERLGQFGESQYRYYNKDNDFYVEAVQIGFHIITNVTLYWEEELFNGNKREENISFNLGYAGVLSMFQGDDGMLGWKNVSSAIKQQIVDALFNKIIANKDFPNWYVITKVTADVSRMWFESNNMIMWNSNYVGKYYVEQECGEGWIMLHRDPQFMLSKEHRVTINIR